MDNRLQRKSATNDEADEWTLASIIEYNSMHQGRGGLSMHIGRIARGICDPAWFDAATSAAQGNVAYNRFFPYHAELCALSEIRKKPGVGVQFRSAMGGHSLLYLNGVRLDRDAGYPILELCDENASPSDHGVGISVNSHYRNANWVAAEGRDFVFRGALSDDEPLTHQSYERTQNRAKAMGVLDGIEFHEHEFRDKPPEMSRRDYMYEISVGTDYAVRFGREVYRAKLPLDRQRMAVIVDFLNALNAPYRDGERVYRWSVFNDNCCHVAHNALAKVGIWAPWPTGNFVVTAAFNFPVPKNEFVDILARGNDLPVDNPRALFGDRVARRALLDWDLLPTAPGALAAVQPAVVENQIYDIERLRLIFYEVPLWGRYQRRFVRIFREPRYFSLAANLDHFAAIYEKARKRLPATRGDAEMMQFMTRYEHYLDGEISRVSKQLGELSCPVDEQLEALI
jgi:hypothetical protein